MKTRRGKTEVKATALDAPNNCIRTDVIEAREIHLVSGEGEDRKSRLSITLDSRGYPMIRMGDVKQACR